MAMRVFILMLAFLVFLVPQGTKAQDILAPEPEAPDAMMIFENLSPALQNRILDESLAVQNVCESNATYRAMYDCQCIALKFIETRLIEGPGGGAVDMAQRHAAGCKDEVKAAGFAYQMCPMITSGMTTGRDEYCECFASSYAKAFAATPSTTLSARQNAVGSALQTCDDETGLER